MQCMNANLKESIYQGFIFIEYLWKENRICGLSKGVFEVVKQTKSFLKHSITIYVFLVSFKCLFLFYLAIPFDLLTMTFEYLNIM